MCELEFYVNGSWHTLKFDSKDEAESFFKDCVNDYEIVGFSIKFEYRFYEK